MTSSALRWTIVAGLLLVVVATMYVIAFATTYIALVAKDDPESPPPDITFDSSTWKAASRVKDEERLLMYRDLMSSYTLHGLSESELTVLLGRPTHRVAVGSLDVWDYRLGREPGIPVDSLWLQLVLEAGEVTQVRLTTD